MIGRKCVKCGKQWKHHSEINFRCPTGKMRRSAVHAYSEFHPENRFTPKPAKPRSSRLSPVAKRGGSRKRKDVETRRSIKAQPCVACEHPESDPAHIRGWLISQCDSAFNITSLCRTHHVEQSAKGWLYMAKKYEGVAKELDAKQWFFIVNESTGDWGMWNAHEVEFNRARRAV